MRSCLFFLYAAYHVAIDCKGNHSVYKKVFWTIICGNNFIKTSFAPLSFHKVISIPALPVARTACAVFAFLS